MLVQPYIDISGIIIIMVFKWKRAAIWKRKINVHEIRMSKTSEKKNNKKKYSLGKTKWLIHRQWFHAFHIFIYVFFVYRLRGNDFTKWITKYALHLFKKRVEFCGYDLWVHVIDFFFSFYCSFEWLRDFCTLQQFQIFCFIF